jgi:PncC family amidohydrolase
MGPQEDVGRLLKERGQTLAIAESLTGGLVTLGVSEDTLFAHGAVSEEVAYEMAEGVMSVMGADWGISSTGIAGPTGETEDKPLGLVYYSVASRRGTVVRRAVFPGDRLEVKRASAGAVLTLLRDALVGNI